MDHQEKLLNVIADSLIKNYIDNHGFENEFDIRKIDEDDLFEMSIRISNYERDNLLMVLKKDYFQEFSALTFKFLKSYYHSYEDVDTKNELKKIIIKAYFEQIKEVLNTAFRCEKLYLTSNDGLFKSAYAICA